MAFNGSGTFARIHNWVTDKANSVKITASRMDTEDDGFATGLSNTICRDGQSTISANIPFNSKKITGLAAGTTAGDSVRYEQVGLLAVANTFTADQTIRSTDAGATIGPRIILDRNSASPAASDLLGAVVFSGRNDAAETVNYGRIYGHLVDPADATEDGRLNIQTMVAGTITTNVVVQSGVYVGSATGGDKGAGTLNAVSLYEDGTALSAKYARLASTNAFTGNIEFGDFSATGATSGKLIDTTSGGSNMDSSRADSAALSHFKFYNTNGQVGSIQTSGSATAYNTSSDARDKIDMGIETDALSKLSAVPIHRARFKADPEGTERPMFFAHELQVALPEAVTGEPDGPERQMVDHSKAVPTIWAAMQDLLARVEALESA
jgi:hypothetical protein